MPFQIKIWSIAQWAAVVYALALSGTWAQLPADTHPKTDNALAYVSRLVDQGAFSGFIHARKAGQVLIHQGFGMADRAGKIPITEHTRFRIGSLTKSFTSAAVLLLHQEGKLALDQSIHGILPEIPAHWKPITPHHLLCHTSGLPDYRSRLGYRKNLHDTAEMLKLFATVEANGPYQAPGRRFEYNDINFIVLGWLVQRVSGMSFSTFAQDRLFEPLGMKDSGFHPAKGEVALGYLNRTEPVNNMLPYHSFSTGSAYAPMTDLVRWLKGLEEHRLLTPETTRLLYVPHVPSPQLAIFGLENTHYGYGWVLGEVKKRPVRLHAGYILGFFSVFGHFPDTGLTIIICSNQQTSPVYEMARQLERLLHAT